MAKYDGPHFALELPLKTEIWQGHVLSKRMEVCGKIYNALINVTNRRYGEMAKTRLYRDTREKLFDVRRKMKTASDKTLIKLRGEEAEYKAILNNLREKHRLSKKEFEKDIVPITKAFEGHIDSQAAQKIASRVWKAYEALMFGDGEDIRYKKFGQMNTIEGKCNTQGIRFVDDHVEWNGLNIPVMIDKKNLYEAMALMNEIAFCRIVRRQIRGRDKFYVQLVMKGEPPPKLDKNTGAFKRRLGKGDVGIDIGTQTVAVASEDSVTIDELADRVQNVEKAKRRIQRKMDRSRRAMNPDNFNPDGTVKKQGSRKVKWEKSKNYLKLQSQLREIHRKQAAIRRLQHHIMANEILQRGNTFYVEDMDFRALAKRAKETKKNDKGKFMRKKRFGKSLANKAPATFLKILEHKLNWHGAQLKKVNTRLVKASQYDHADDSYKKKKLGQRWATVGGHKVQRDMYSSFLIRNVTPDLNGIDKDKCDARFDKFLTLHDMEVKRLTGRKNLSSIGI